jgi:pilus assembly protein CpaF
MVLFAGVELPVRAIREQIASAIDLIVHQARFRDGSRKVAFITEVQGMEGEVIVLQDVFRYVQKGVDERGRVQGENVWTVVQTRCMERIRAEGIELGPEVFSG